MLGARRSWNDGDWAGFGYMAAVLICTWITTPDGAGFLFLFSLVFWMVILFVPFCVFAVIWHAISAIYRAL